MPNRTPPSFSGVGGVVIPHARIKVARSARLDVVIDEHHR
jgi:hypothetical protein